jgi:hypothetical protein
LLGPSSRGAMKVYKNIIHPMLVSREQVKWNLKVFKSMFFLMKINFRKLMT